MLAFEGNRFRGRVRLAAVGVVVALLIGACGGDESGGEAGAREALDGFIEGWVAGSGTRSDSIRAQQTRRFLGGAFGEQVQGVRPGEGLERMFNEMVGAPFPPDDGHEVIGEPEVTDNEAVFRVLLRYTSRAAAAMVGAGFISQAEADNLQAEVADGVERTFVLRLNDDEWRIFEIME